MALCTVCAAENPDGVQFCTKCGATFPNTGPAPDYAQPPPPSAEYTPTGGAGTYNPYNSQQSPMPYPQPVPPPQGEPPHPALAAVVSLFFPGMGLLFVPNKQGLGIGIFAGTIVTYAILLIAYFF